MGQVLSASGRRVLVQVRSLDGVPEEGRVLLDLPEPGPVRGDLLAVFGRSVPLLDPALPGEQDPSALARSQGVASRLRVDQVQIFGVPQRLSPAFDEARHGGVLRALAAGDRGGVNPETLDLLRRTGTRHLLAISGLHVGLVAGLGALCGRALCRPWIALWPLLGAGWLRFFPVLTGLAAGWAYAAAAGSAVSARRALWMVMGVLLGAASGRGVRPWNLLGGAALAVSLSSPWEVRTLAFGLSFCAVAGILWVVPRLVRWLPPDLPRPVSWLAGSVAATLGATAGTLPLVAWVFQDVAWTAPLANALAVPLIGGVAVPASLLGALGLPGAVWLADGAVEVAFTWLQWVAGPVAHPSVGILGAALVVAAVGALSRPGLSLFLALAACLRAHGVGVLTVTFLAVGQGDATLVELPGGGRLLVDGGPPSRRVLHWLRRAGILWLDEVVLTHPHPDHAGGLLPVLEELGVGGLRVPRFPRPEEDGFVDLWVAAQEREVPLIGPHEPSLDGVDVLHPSLEFLERIDDLNEASVVLRITHGQTDLLLTGDIEERGEEALLRGDISPVDWLKIPHHGSLTSSAPALVAALAPRVAVACSGVENRYRHPRPEVVSRYLRQGAQVLRTDTQGTVQLRSDGRRESWRSWRPGQGWSSWSTLEPGGSMEMLTFQSSRWTAGNVFFPDRVTLEENHVLYQKNGIIKRDKETIQFEQISSVSVRRGWFFALLVLETTGGTRPIVLNGLWASEAEAARTALMARIHERQVSLEDRVLGLLEEQNQLLKRLVVAAESGSPPT